MKKKKIKCLLHNYYLTNEFIYDKFNFSIFELIILYIKMNIKVKKTLCYLCNLIIVQLIKENLILWSSEMNEEEEN